MCLSACVQTVWFCNEVLEVPHGGTVEGQVTMYPNKYNRRSVDISMQYGATGTDQQFEQSWAFNGA